MIELRQPGSLRGKNCSPTQAEQGSFDVFSVAAYLVFDGQYSLDINTKKRKLKRNCVIMNIENIQICTLVIPVYPPSNTHLNEHYFIFIAPIMIELAYLSILFILPLIYHASRAGE